MRIAMIAALAAALLPAGPARAEQRPPEEPAIQERGLSTEAPLRLPAGDETAVTVRADAPQASSRAKDAREDKPRKGKSTADKVLTGAAVVLGIGAIAVGGLLVAILVG